ncbi:MAG TPA: YIP1 family protein [Gammaproteobacteria bacterium]|nr:YIP1 family protein [Gammaproteobacteria bacterium]
MANRYPPSVAARSPRGGSRPRSAPSASAAREQRSHLPGRLLGLTAIPPVCALIAALLAHWRAPPADALYMGPLRAVLTALAYYLVLVTGMRITARALRWLARSYQIPITARRAAALVGEMATPLLVVGLVALTPWLWFHLAAGLAALVASAYLVWRRVPKALNLSGTRAHGFCLGVWVLGATMLVFMLAATVLLWDAGLAPGLTI